MQKTITICGALSAVAGIATILTVDPNAAGNYPP